MTEKPDDDVPHDGKTVREARGAAREVIGKLIGDDAAVIRGKAEQDAAAHDAHDAPDEPQDDADGDDSGKDGDDKRRDA